MSSLVVASQVSLFNDLVNSLKKDIALTHTVKALESRLEDTTTSHQSLLSHVSDLHGLLHTSAQHLQELSSSQSAVIQSLQCLPSSTQHLTTLTTLFEGFDETHSLPCLPKVIASQVVIIFNHLQAASPLSQQLRTPASRMQRQSQRSIARHTKPQLRTHQQV